MDTHTEPSITIQYVYTSSGIPSFTQAVFGAGIPSAAHSMKNGSPILGVGVISTPVKIGTAVSNNCTNFKVY